MVTPELLNYVLSELRKTPNKDILKANLIASGWAEKDIQDAISQAVGHIINDPVSSTIPADTIKLAPASTSSRSINPVYIFGILALAVVAASLYWIKFKPNGVKLSSVDTSIPTTWQTFTSTGSPRYSAEYPADWQAAQVKADVAFVNPQKLGSISIVYDANRSGFSGYYASMQQAASQKLDNVKIVSHSTNPINGLQSELVEITLTGPQSKSKIHQIHTEILSSPDLYAVDLIMSDSDKNLTADETIYMKLLNSFTVQ